MPKRSSTAKPKSDPAEAAHDVLQHVIRQTEGEPEVEAKNPAAVALGRLGGLKGGKARAEKLSARKRSEIARAAAKTRWSSR